VIKDTSLKEASGAECVTLQKYFPHLSLGYLFFCNPTHKTETDAVDRWETTNSKPLGPIITCMQERTVEEGLYERLKLGYDVLSEDDWRLKDCFLYFAAFPEDSKIYFERILRYCIAEGLVPAHDGDDPRADAFSLLNKLWERSFIE